MENNDFLNTPAENHNPDAENKPQQKIGNKKFMIKGKKKIFTAECRDVVYCNASANYAEIIMRGNEKILVSKPLKAVEKMLDYPSLVRIHKSHLVNIECIKSFNKENFTVTLQDNTRLSISVRKRGEFLRALMEIN